MSEPPFGAPHPVTIFAIRSRHGVITAFFLACIAYECWFGITDRGSSALAVAAVVSLLGEGIVVTANHGDCPLGGIHRNAGDDRAFFELMLPQRAAKLAVPVLGIVAALGAALAGARVLA